MSYWIQFLQNELISKIIASKKKKKKKKKQQNKNTLIDY